MVGYFKWWINMWSYFEKTPHGCFRPKRLQHCCAQWWHPAPQNRYPDWPWMAPEHAIECTQVSARYRPTRYFGATTDPHPLDKVWTHFTKKVGSGIYARNNEQNHVGDVDGQLPGWKSLLIIAYLLPLLSLNKGYKECQQMCIALIGGWQGCPISCDATPAVYKPQGISWRVWLTNSKKATSHANIHIADWCSWLLKSWNSHVFLWAIPNWPSTDISQVVASFHAYPLKNVKFKAIHARCLELEKITDLVHTEETASFVPKWSLPGNVWLSAQFIRNHHCPSSTSSSTKWSTNW